MSNDSIVGKSVPRKEGRDKVTGTSQYVDDMVLPDMLFGATVRSQIPRGRIRRITFSPQINWDEFVIVAAKDIPGKNCISLISDDQPCLANEVVNHPEEPLLLLAHPDRHLLPQAVAAIAIEYEPWPAIFTMEESERRSEIIWGEDNIFKTYLIEKGEHPVQQTSAHPLLLHGGQNARLIMVHGRQAILHKLLEINATPFDTRFSFSAGEKLPSGPALASVAIARSVTRPFSWPFSFLS